MHHWDGTDEILSVNICPSFRSRASGTASMRQTALRSLVLGLVAMSSWPTLGLAGPATPKPDVLFVAFDALNDWLLRRSEMERCSGRQAAQSPWWLNVPPV